MLDVCFCSILEPGCRHMIWILPFRWTCPRRQTSTLSSFLSWVCCSISGQEVALPSWGWCRRGGSFRRRQRRWNWRWVQVQAPLCELQVWLQFLPSMCCNQNCCCVGIPTVWRLWCKRDIYWKFLCFGAHRHSDAHWVKDFCVLELEEMFMINLSDPSSRDKSSPVTTWSKLKLLLEMSRVFDEINWL